MVYHTPKDRLDESKPKSKAYTLKYESHTSTCVGSTIVERNANKFCLSSMFFLHQTKTCMCSSFEKCTQLLLNYNV